MTSPVKPAAALLLATPLCSAGSTSIFCNLNSVLRVLYVLAGVLALVLLVVIVIAVQAWRKSKSADLTRP